MMKFVGGSRRDFLSDTAGAVTGLLAQPLIVPALASDRGAAAGEYVPFEGEKTTWHEGFERYDFIMDDAIGAITPIKAPEDEVTGYGIDPSVKGGKRRCVVVAPGEGGARPPVVMARLLLEPPAPGRNRAAQTWFSHRLCRARQRQAGQSLGRILPVSNGEAWAVEEAGLHRDE